MIDKNKLHTTNYSNTFIEVADDCPATLGEIPPLNEKSKSIAGLQYELLQLNPYKFTSDDILCQVYAIKNDLTEAELEDKRKLFYSKGQPCFRSSPLTKRYGWGIHSDKNGKAAMFAIETEEYQEFLTDKTIKTVKAMRSTKK